MDLRPDRDSGVPVTTQLTWRLRALIDRGDLAPGARLPSVREAASSAGVNVNTIRAVYAKLEAAGVVATEQGRGTFVAAHASGDEAAERRRLHEQIARLEAELVSLPVLPPDHAADAAEGSGRPRRARLLSLAELTAARDLLDERVQALRATRAEIAGLLEQRSADQGATDDERATSDADPAVAAASHPWSPTVAGARIRWAGS